MAPSCVSTYTVQPTTFLSVQEVRKHNHDDDCWVVVGGKVYDVTTFLQQHPGGADFILKHAGEDITDVLTDINIHNHTNAAYNLLKSYYVGDLDGGIKFEDENNNHDTKKEITPEADMCGWNEDLVDWNKGMVFQAHKYGKDYFKWVHSPVTKKLRLFDSDFVEYFSKTAWWVIPLIWLPVALCFLLPTLFKSHHQFTIESDIQAAIETITTGLFVLVLGLPIWSFLEYMLHRFVFHLEPSETSDFMITFHFLMHGQHHKVPFDKGRLVFPPVPAFVIASPIAFLLHNFVTYGDALMSGIILGYVSYDLIHYYLHHGTPTRGSYFHSLKYYHVLHHFDDFNTGFGISSKFWDYPFATINDKLKKS